MKSSMQSRIPLVAGVLVLAMVISVILGMRARDKQIESRRLVVHTYQVLTTLEQLNSTVKDAETGQRGYLLTGSDSYLADYSRAIPKIDQLLSQLKELTSDNPVQQRRLDTLSSRSNEKLSELAQTIDLRRTSGFEAARKVVLTNRGKAAMDGIRRLVAEMIATEKELLQGREADLDDDTQRSALLSNWFSLFSIVSLIVAGALLRRFVGAQEQIERDLKIKYSIVRTLNESDDLVTALRSVEKLISDSNRWSIAATWLLDDAGQTLTCRDVLAQAPLVESDFVTETKSRTFKFDEGLPGRCWASEKPIWVVDVMHDKTTVRTNSADKAGLHGAMAFPISSGGSVIGVLEFFSDVVQAPNQHQLLFYETVGQEIGLLIARLQAQDKVAISEGKFKAIFDSTYEFIGLISPDGVLLEGNETALRFAGVKSAQVVGKPFWDTPWWTHLESAQQACKEAVATAASGGLARFESTHPAADGRQFEFDVSIKPVYDDHGKLTYLIAEGRDITDKKEAEKRVSEFYSTVSHELRTPLTSIRGSLGLIEGGLAGAISEKATKLIKIARSESDRLIRLINDILDLRKIEAGMFELKKTTVETERLVERTIEGITGMAQGRHVTLVSEIKTTGPVMCDEDRVVQILTNLIANAIKFSPAGESVNITLQPGASTTFRFSVADRGPGIPNEQMHKLFGKFQQIDQSDTRKVEGTGLGLAITKMLVEQHDGTIGVESEVGKGSTFWFELPAIFCPAPMNHAQPELDSHIRPALIIEDDDSISEIIKEHLQQDNFEVVRATSIAEARALLEQYKPYLIVLDLNLPDGDGLDLLRSLSSDEQRQQIPVVVVTGRDKNGTVQCGYPTIIDWISKPFDENALHKAFTAARQKVGPAHVLLVEDDPAAREVMRQQLENLGIACLEAKDGAEAIKTFRDANPDLIILDLAIPAPDGFAVVDVLRQEPNGCKPLIVYTAMDVNQEQKELLKLGLTAYLTKSVTSVDSVIGTVREFLDGLLPRDDSP
ncbi:MAG TPA: CHASE3 domain-containing protein [Planktothrix sp.]|jgi:PAS domain S-box-containing protein